MGPFIPRRQKQDWEIFGPTLEQQVTEIVDAITSGRRRLAVQTTRAIHGGRWVGDDEYIECTSHGCRWRTEGPGGWTNNHLHLRQWNEHRVREGILAGIPIEWREY